MVDVLAAFGAVLHSVWLLPVLALLIAADAPLPVLPSETLLMAASALAFGAHDAPAVLGLFLAAVIGSAMGDMITFGLGRSSHRLVSRSVDARYGISSWVCRHLHLRPGLALVGARLVPGGRLVSTAAAGRYGLTLRRFLPWTLASSAVWTVYMLLVGLLLGPLTGGSPLLALAAGVAMAVVTAAVFAVVQRVRAGRTDPAAGYPDADLSLSGP